MDNANVQPHLMRCRKALRRKQIQRRKMKSETAHDFRTSDTVAVTPRQTTVCRAEAGIDGRAEARPSEADGAVALQQGLKDYREKVSRLQEDGGGETGGTPVLREQAGPRKAFGANSNRTAAGGTPCSTGSAETAKRRRVAALPSSVPVSSPSLCALCPATPI